MKAKTQRINVVLNTNILKIIDKYASKQSEDRSTAIRQLILMGFYQSQVAYLADMYHKGEITLRQIGEYLGLSYWEVQDFMARNNVDIQDLDDDLIHKRKKLVHSILKSAR